MAGSMACARPAEDLHVTMDPGGRTGVFATRHSSVTRAPTQTARTTEDQEPDGYRLTGTGAPSRHRPGDARGFNRTTACSGSKPARRQAPLLKPPTGMTPAAPSANVYRKFYDLRVNEGRPEPPEREFRPAACPWSWQQVGCCTIGLLHHRQPGWHETLLRSAPILQPPFSRTTSSSCVRRSAPEISSRNDGAPHLLPGTPARLAPYDVLEAARARRPDRDISPRASAVAAAHANFQFQVLSSLFYRNRRYIVSEIINGHRSAVASRPARSPTAAW